jgi:hypothetical protein
MVPKQVYEFTDSRQAEVLARCCRVWVDPALDNLDPDSVALAEAVLKVRQRKVDKPGASWSSANVLRMFCECSANVLRMFCECSANVLRPKQTCQTAYVVYRQ